MAGLLDAVPGVRAMRDATRGGVATILNEIAKAANVGVLVSEDEIPVRAEVRGASELLGIDPMYVACEGRLVAVVPAGEADHAVAALRAHPLGEQAAVIGHVRDEQPGIVQLRPRSAAPGSSTSWSATPCRGSANPRVWMWTYPPESGVWGIYPPKGGLGGWVPPGAGGLGGSSPRLAESRAAATTAWPRLIPPSLQGTRECTRTRKPRASSRPTVACSSSEVLEHPAGQRHRAQAVPVAQSQAARLDQRGDAVVEASRDDRRRDPGR